MLHRVLLSGGGRGAAARSVTGVHTSAAQTGFADLVDHIHLAAPDQAKAVEWYHAHFGAGTKADARRPRSRDAGNDTPDLFKR